MTVADSMYRTLLLLALIVAGQAGAQSFDTSILRPVGYHPSNIAYYNAPYFANALYQGGEWYSFPRERAWDARRLQHVAVRERVSEVSDAGTKLRALLFGLNIANPYRPAGWPDRETLARGRIVVTWKGNADIRLVRGTFVADGSSGGATGNLMDGRRVYLCTAPGQSTQSLEIHGIGTPLTEIRVWLDGLEGRLFHPLLLQRIADADWGFIRFMDWGRRTPARNRIGAIADCRRTRS